MYCKDCKFYMFDQMDNLFDKMYNEIKMELKRGKCLNPNHKYGYELSNKSELIYYDSIDYFANLYVGELFGCVHFRDKGNE